MNFKLLEKIFYNPEYGETIFNYNTPKKILITTLKNISKGIYIIKLDDIYKTTKPFNETSFYKQNKSKLNNDYTIKPEIIIEITKRYKQAIKIRENGLEEKEETGITGEEIFTLNHLVELKHIYDTWFKTSGEAIFKYDFTTPIQPNNPKINDNTLQRWKLQILQLIQEISFPVKYKYHCEECGNDTYRSLYDVSSTNNKGSCDGETPTINGNIKRCNNKLNPNAESDYIKMFMYEVGVREEGGETVCYTAFSTHHLRPFSYECVGLVLNNNNQSSLLILDVMNIESVNIPLDSLPTPTTTINRDENETNDIIIEYQKLFDQFIKEKTGMDIIGMNDLKIFMILQKLNSTLQMPLYDNIKVVGDKGVGKSLTLTYYGILLYGFSFMQSASTDISIASLRGSGFKNNALNISGETPALLCEYENIYIDELKDASQNLILELKSQLSKDTVSNNKADGKKYERKRKAQLNTAQNFHEIHQKTYMKKIREVYELNMGKYDDAPPFDTDWDLQQPIKTYENECLRKALYIVRQGFYNAGIDWLDGDDMAANDRFPYRLVIKQSIDMEAANELLKKKKKSLSLQAEYNTNINTIDLKQKISSENINYFFESFKRFDNYHPADEEEDEIINTLSNILDEYNLSHGDDRLFRFIRHLLKLSRIINMRTKYNKIDYDRVRRFLSLYNRGVRVEELLNYKPKRIKFKQVEESFEIEETDESFGIMEGEFEK